MDILEQLIERAKASASLPTSSETTTASSDTRL